MENPTKSPKSKTTTMILCCLGFIGIGGIHCFYVGKTGRGLLKLFTANWFGIGTVIDLIIIANGNYKDGVGLKISE